MLRVLLSATNGGIANEELLENIARSLVDNPDEVSVTEVEDDQSLILELRVAEDDMGKVIGKQGRIAKAIRVVMKAAAIKEKRGCCRDNQQNKKAGRVKRPPPAFCYCY